MCAAPSATAFCTLLFSAVFLCVSAVTMDEQCESEKNTLFGPRVLFSVPARLRHVQGQVPVLHDRLVCTNRRTALVPAQ